MVKAGEATNIIPDDAYVGGTARFFNKEEGEKALEIIERIARNTAIPTDAALNLKREIISAHILL